MNTRTRLRLLSLGLGSLNTQSFSLSAFLPSLNSRLGHSATSSKPFSSSSLVDLPIIRGGSQQTTFLQSDGVNGETKEGANIGNDPDKDNLKPQTGWNHNLPPKKESSTFWKLEEGQESSTPKKSESTDSRTGWLHNTKSTKTKKEEQGESAAKKDSAGLARKLLEQAKMKQKLNHRIINPPAFHAVGDDRRAVITEHLLSQPLDRSNPDDEQTVDIYFTVVELITSPEQEAFYQSLQKTAPPSTKWARVREQQDRAEEYKSFIGLKDANECCLYLQGGPGFGAPRPIDGIGLGQKSSWVGAALGKGYKRVVLMDQRGTGRSSTITKQTLQKRFPDLFKLDDVCGTFDGEEGSSMTTVENELMNKESTHGQLVDKVRTAMKDATDYMTNFRADNIVKDAEAVKDVLLLPFEEDANVTPRPWGAALGQSFGGFCMMTYLSLIPNPPKICLFTGGIAPMLTPVDDVYGSLRERVKTRNHKFYDTYPGDVALVKRIVKSLSEKPATLPSGGRLTARRFLQVGISLGGSPSAFASMHGLFSSAFLSEDDDDLTRSFLKTIDSIQPFDDHPIYFLMHESIYADGQGMCKTTNWSANRAYQSDTALDYEASCLDDANPTFLAGEVVFPWMADGDYSELSGFGMQSLAHSLACKDDWNTLYDAYHMRKVLADDGTGVSKAAAAVYYDDMYVDFDACMKVTQRGGPLEKCKVWITNEYQHSGLRDDGVLIFEKILGMANGSDGTPS